MQGGGRLCVDPIFKEDWDSSLERFAAFWEREIVDRCCVAVTGPREGMAHPEPQSPPETLDALVRNWLDPELNLRRMLAHFGRTFYGGEAYPATTMCLGASVMAEFHGARAEFRTDTVWYHAVLDTIADFDTDADVTATPLYEATMAATRYYAEESRGRYWVGLPELGSATDNLSLLRGMQPLLYDMLDNPEAVKEAIQRLAGTWRAVHSELYEIARPHTSDGCCIPWMRTWAPGPQYQMSCDFSSVLSPGMFLEFIVPEIERYLEVNTYSVYHWDGPDAVKHLDALLELADLKAIQWTPGEGQPPTSSPRWLPFYRRIQDAGKCLILPCVTIDEVESLLSTLSSRGLLIATYAADERECRNLLASVAKWTRD